LEVLQIALVDALGVPETHARIAASLPTLFDGADAGVKNRRRAASRFMRVFYGKTENVSPGCYRRKL